MTSNEMLTEYTEMMYLKDFRSSPQWWTYTRTQYESMSEIFADMSAKGFIDILEKNNKFRVRVTHKGLKALEEMEKVYE